jgi:FixJ family two-component response regulator
MATLNPTVFVVDTDLSVGASLGVLIRRAGWRPVHLMSAEDFLARPALRTPSCLMLKFGYPDLDDFDLLRRIVADRKEMSAIVIAGEADVPMSVGAIKAGAVEFLVRPVADEVLLAVIRHAIRLSAFVLQQEAALLQLRERYDGLSRREREVMGRVVSGFLNKQVGAALGISEITVKAHRGRVMRKMGADSLPELVRMAMSLRVPPTIEKPSITQPRIGWNGEQALAQRFDYSTTEVWGRTNSTQRIPVSSR